MHCKCCTHAMSAAENAVLALEQQGDTNRTVVSVAVAVVVVVVAIAPSSVLFRLADTAISALMSDLARHLYLSNHQILLTHLELRRCLAFRRALLMAMSRLVFLHSISHFEEGKAPFPECTLLLLL